MAMSPKAVAVALESETSEREVCLLTITHPQWTEAVRLSTDATQYLRDDPADGSPIFGTMSRGMEFLYVPISPVLPDSQDESPPIGRVAIDNVSRIVAPYLRRIDTGIARVTVEVVLASTPDIVDQVWPEMELQTSTFDASRVEVTIGLDTATNEASPWMRFIPSSFPNLFD